MKDRNFAKSLGMQGSEMVKPGKDETRKKGILQYMSIWPWSYEETIVDFEVLLLTHLFSVCKEKILSAFLWNIKPSISNKK